MPHFVTCLTLSGFQDLCGSVCYLSQTGGNRQIPLEAVQ